MHRSVCSIPFPESSLLICCPHTFVDADLGALDTVFGEGDQDGITTLLCLDQDHISTEELKLFERARTELSSLVVSSTINLLGAALLRRIAVAGSCSGSLGVTMKAFSLFKQTFPQCVSSAFVLLLFPSLMQGRQVPWIKSALTRTCPWLFRCRP